MYHAIANIRDNLDRNESLVCTLEESLDTVRPAKNLAGTCTVKGRKILILSRDPGGTNAVMQLIEPLRALGNEIQLYGKDAALSIYRKLNLDCSDISESIPSGTQEETNEFVRTVSPDLIVTGTSSEDFTERHLWRAARRRGLQPLRSLTSGRTIAFGLSPKETIHGRPSRIGPHSPFLLLHHGRFREEGNVCAGNRPREALVSGQPFFDYVRKTGRGGDGGDRRTAGKLTGTEDGLVFVFASQPLASIHRMNGMAEDHWGYTEETILQKVVKCFRS